MNVGVANYIFEGYSVKCDLHKISKSYWNFDLNCNFAIVGTPLGIETIPIGP